jgi:ATP-binding cassette subfamily B protein
MAAVRELARERAVLVISHRLANVVDASCIYVLRDGRVVGAGTHGELLANCEEYGRLWGEQQALEAYGRGERHGA